MKRIFKSLIVLIFTLFSVSAFAVDYNLTDYYSYTDVENGVKVSLTSGFQTALKNNESYNDWDYGTPLPNPAPDGMYDGKNVTDMSGMFYLYTSTKELDLSNFDTSNVTTMRNMFLSCSSLTSLDLSNFDTSNVTDMYNMFSNCPNITIDLSNFNTSKVTTMRGMFAGCSSFINLDSLDTSNVINMSWMFSGCPGVKEIDLNSFNTSKVTDMSFMFYNCPDIEKIYLENFDTSNVTNMSTMFENCNVLTGLDLSSFTANKISNMSDMFRACSSIHYIDLASMEIPQNGSVTLTNMLKNCGEQFEENGKTVPARCRLKSEDNAAWMEEASQITATGQNKNNLIFTYDGDPTTSVESVGSGAIRIYGTMGAI